MPSYHLPNLKLLLLSASFISEDGFLPRLVASCPLLEDLTFEPFTIHVHITAIVSTSLRRLCLRMKRVEEIALDSSDFVLIDTPNLEYLEYSDNLTMCYSIPIMHCLVKAVLVIRQILEFEEFEVSFEQILSLIRPLSYVQYLSLFGCLMQEFAGVDEKVLKDQLPVFPNLKHLELGCGTVDHFWNKLLLPFLNCSPVLETLVFAEGLIDNFNDKYRGYAREQLELEREFFRTTHEIPSCCRYRLKRIVIKRCYGLEREVRMIQFFLRHALVLEELVICPFPEVPISDRMLVENTLNNLPKASVTCSIQVL